MVALGAAEAGARALARVCWVIRGPLSFSSPRGCARQPAVQELVRAPQRVAMPSSLLVVGLFGLHTKSRLEALLALSNTVSATAHALLDAPTMGRCGSRHQVDGILVRSRALHPDMQRCFLAAFVHVVDTDSASDSNVARRGKAAQPRARRPSRLACRIGAARSRGYHPRRLASDGRRCPQHAGCISRQ